MMWFINTYIRKIFVSFVIILICTLGLGLFALDRLSTLNQGTGDIRENWLPSIEVLSSIRNTFEAYRIVESAHIIDTAPEDIDKEEKALEAYLKDMNMWLARYEPLVIPGYEANAFQAFKSTWVRYLAISQNNLLPLSRKNNMEEAIKLYHGDSYEFYHKAREQLQLIIDFNIHGSRESADVNTDIYTHGKLLIIAAITITALLICSLAGWMVTATQTNKAPRQAD